MRTRTIIGAAALLAVVILTAVVIVGIMRTDFTEYEPVNADNGDPYVMASGNYTVVNGTVHYNGTLEPAMEGVGGSTKGGIIFLTLIGAVILLVIAMVVISEITPVEFPEGK